MNKQSLFASTFRPFKETGMWPKDNLQQGDWEEEGSGVIVFLKVLWMFLS